MDENDLQLLTTDKREEMILQGVENPSYLRRTSSPLLACHQENRGDPGPDIRDNIVFVVSSYLTSRGLLRCGEYNNSTSHAYRTLNVYIYKHRPVPVGYSCVHVCQRINLSRKFHLHINRFIPGRRINI